MPHKRQRRRVRRHTLRMDRAGVQRYVPIPPATQAPPANSKPSAPEHIRPPTSLHIDNLMTDLFKLSSQTGPAANAKHLQIGSQQMKNLNGRSKNSLKAVLMGIFDVWYKGKFGSKNTVVTKVGSRTQNQFPQSTKPEQLLAMQLSQTKRALDAAQQTQAAANAKSKEVSKADLFNDFMRAIENLRQKARAITTPVPVVAAKAPAKSHQRAVVANQFENQMNQQTSAKTKSATTNVKTKTQVFKNNNMGLNTKLLTQVQPKVRNSEAKILSKQTVTKLDNKPIVMNSKSHYNTKTNAFPKTNVNTKLRPDTKFEQGFNVKQGSRLTLKPQLDLRNIQTRPRENKLSGISSSGLNNKVSNTKVNSNIPPPILDTHKSTQTITKLNIQRSIDTSQKTVSHGLKPQTLSQARANSRQTLNMKSNSNTMNLNSQSNIGLPSNPRPDTHLLTKPQTGSVTNDQTSIQHVNVQSPIDTSPQIQVSSNSKSTHKKLSLQSDIQPSIRSSIQLQAKKHKTTRPEATLSASNVQPNNHNGIKSNILSAKSQSEMNVNSGPNIRLFTDVPPVSPDNANSHRRLNMNTQNKIKSNIVPAIQTNNGLATNNDRTNTLTQPSIDKSSNIQQTLQTKTTQTDTQPILSISSNFQPNLHENAYRQHTNTQTTFNSFSTNGAHTSNANSQPMFDSMFTNNAQTSQSNTQQTFNSMSRNNAQAANTKIQPRFNSMSTNNVQASNTNSQPTFNSMSTNHAQALHKNIQSNNGISSNIHATSKILVQPKIGTSSNMESTMSRNANTGVNIYPNIQQNVDMGSNMQSRNGQFNQHNIGTASNLQSLSNFAASQGLTMLVLPMSHSGFNNNIRLASNVQSNNQFNHQPNIGLSGNIQANNGLLTAIQPNSQIFAQTNVHPSIQSHQHANIIVQSKPINQLHNAGSIQMKPQTKISAGTISLWPASPIIIRQSPKIQTIGVATRAPVPTTQVKILDVTAAVFKATAAPTAAPTAAIAKATASPTTSVSKATAAPTTTMLKATAAPTALITKATAAPTTTMSKATAAPSTALASDTASPATAMSNAAAAPTKTVPNATAAPSKQTTKILKQVATTITKKPKVPTTPIPMTTPEATTTEIPVVVGEESGSTTGSPSTETILITTAALPVVTDPVPTTVIPSLIPKALAKTPAPTHAPAKAPAKQPAKTAPAKTVAKKPALAKPKPKPKRPVVKPKPKPRPTPPTTTPVPQIDPDLLGDINEARVSQGKSMLTADQVDVNGNILPPKRPLWLQQAARRFLGARLGLLAMNRNRQAPREAVLTPHQRSAANLNPAHYDSIHNAHIDAHMMAGPMTPVQHQTLHKMLSLSGQNQFNYPMATAPPVYPVATAPIQTGNLHRLDPDAFAEYMEFKGQV